MANSKLRVDNIPWAIRPFYRLISELLAWCVIGPAILVKVTCKLEIRGGNQFASLQPQIFCSWHDSFIPLICTLSLRPLKQHVWMNHPAFYMKPVHLILRFIGVRKIILGSSGEEGRSAIDQLAMCLRNGYSTYIFPDGPAGPPRKLKRGVVHLAEKSGVQIVPVRFITPKALIFNLTWDGKRLPLPFTKIIVEFGPPISVQAGGLDEAEQRLLDSL